MKPVDQTIFGVPDGNCFAACVASLMGLALEDVPNFCSHKDWFERLRVWLAPRGFVPIAFEPSDACGTDDLFDHVGDAFAIVGGRAARGHLHACVYRGGRLVHDPHPSRAGLLSVKDVIVFVCVDPCTVSAFGQEGTDGRD